MTSPVPPRLPIPGGHALALAFTQGGQTGVVVLGAKSTTNVFMVKTDAQAWVQNAWDSFKPLISGTVTCTGATCRSVDGSNLVWELNAPTNPAGTAVGNLQLAAASALLKWNTATGGRSGKGRTFLPGSTVNHVDTDGRSYTAAMKTAAATAINAYLAGAPFSGGGGIQPAILSYRKGAAYPITSGALASVVGVQRRRMRG